MNETNFKFDNAVISDDANGLQDIHIKTKNIAIYHHF